MAEQSVARQGYLLLADISGYTSYLAAAELDHAHEVVSDLLELITARLSPVYLIAKLEGDAVFAYAPAESVSRPEQILEAVEATYVAFRNRLEAANRRTTCSCKACRSIPALDLKFVVHFGTYVRRRIAGAPDLVGSDVNIVHRLLKNSIGRVTGWNAYVLLSDSARTQINIEPSGLHQGTEEYEHLERITTYAFDLHRRYAEISSERRILQKLGEPDFRYTISVKAPLPVVWEWLNDPVKRKITDKADVSIEKRVGGRIKEGATFHCAHGENVSVEEVVEWKPYSSFALEHRESFGTILFVHDLIQEGDGVRVELRAKMFPRLRFLKPFARMLMKIGAKRLGFEEQLERFRTSAEIDWEHRSEELVDVSTQ
ncbi:MAG: DUF2652 domain-containing protein [Ignavibacteriales bacterium]|nr:DUF2652 domain-containing protein [Ignavibacteriales bacterium]